MRLEELLEHIDENTAVIVVDWEDQVIADYDGRNSIPEDLSYEEVNMIWVEDGQLKIGVQCAAEDYVDFDTY